MTDPDLRFRPHPDVVSTELDSGERVLLDLSSMRYFSLNETGALIWSILQEHADPAEIGARLAERYAVAPEEARAFVHAFLRKLAADGLVVPAET